jgi:hypothetical protein
MDVLLLRALAPAWMFTESLPSNGFIRHNIIIIIIIVIIIITGFRLEFCMYLSITMHATCLTPNIVVDLVNPVTYGEDISCDAPRYAVVSSTPCSKTICTLPLGWEIMFHIHTSKINLRLCSWSVKSSPKISRINIYVQILNDTYQYVVSFCHTVHF